MKIDVVYLLLYRKYEWEKHIILQKLIQGWESKIVFVFYNMTGSVISVNQGTRKSHAGAVK